MLGVQVEQVNEERERGRRGTIVVENLEYTHERLLPFLSGWSATRKLGRKDFFSAQHGKQSLTGNEGVISQLWGILWGHHQHFSTSRGK
jgi:hypothetical protein